MTLEHEAEDGSHSPCHACRADDPGGPLECLGVEYPAIHEQDGDFDHEDCESVSYQGGADSLRIVSVELRKHWIEHEQIYLEEGLDLVQG